MRNITQPVHPKYKVEEKRWEDMLAKLEVFSQTDLAKIVYFDADVLLMHNVDFLFDLPTGNWIWAQVDGTGCHRVTERLNAGIMVLSPNVTLRNELFHVLDDPLAKLKTAGEQDMLQYYLVKTYVPFVSYGPYRLKTWAARFLRSLDFSVFWSMPSTS